MLHLALAIGSFGFVVWLLFRAWAQRDDFPPLKKALPEEPCAVTIVLPVRDEAATIGDALQALHDLDYPKDLLEVIVVDDGSSDGTPDIVMRAGGASVRLVFAPPLARGWTGKAQACFVGAQAARADARYLLFIDADVRLGSEAVASLVAQALRTRTHLLSASPRLVLRSLSERLVLPCGLYMLAFLQDLKHVAEGADARACGQMMMADRDAYRKVDGHRAVRGDICEDLALARLMHAEALTVSMLDGGALADVRMYRGWRDLREGLSKNVVETLGGRTRALRLAILTLAVVAASIMLPAAAVSACRAGTNGSCAASAFWLVIALAALGFHVAGAIHFRIPLWAALLFPLGYVLCAFIALDGIARQRRGRIAWKGRVYGDTAPGDTQPGTGHLPDNRTI